MAYRIIVATITEKPSHLTEAAGFMSNSSRTGISFGLSSGLKYVSRYMTINMKINVIAMRFRKATAPNCHCRKPYTGTVNNKPVTPAIAGARLKTIPKTNTANIPGEI